ncbi:MAG: hypothetical protein D6722_24345 [Bacteroidetes bacterium]|nr:MAG: hypothetical protein D6722_24345 [Bacteroidota bacterium]
MLMLGLMPGLLPAQAPESDHVFLVLLDLAEPADIARCYTTRFDVKRIRLDLPPEAPLANLDEFGLTEDPLPGTACFVPEIKLIYETTTYVISLYCSQVIQYQNAGPYQPSAQRIPNDLILTEGLQAYLQGLRREQLGDRPVSQKLIARVVTADPIREPSLSEDGFDELMESLLDETLLDSLSEDADLELEEPTPRLLPEEADPDEDDQR